MIVLLHYNIVTAEVMVAEFGITLHNGGIRTCYGPSGELYCLPMFVINPPEKYGTEKITEDDKEPGEALIVTYLKNCSLK